MLDRYRHIIFIFLLIITLGGMGVYYLNRPTDSPIESLSVKTTATLSPVNTPSPSLPTLTPSPTPSPLRVYITGAVITPDVYLLPPRSIVKDVIALAGGLTAEADWERFNQALELKDQQHIHIPRIGEKDAPPAVQDGITHGNQPNQSNESATPTGLINLNTASLEQLDSLPQIGPVMAQRIIDYRDSHGSFKTIEEITQVSGIGDSTFNKIKDLITVE